MEDHELKKIVDTQFGRIKEITKDTPYETVEAVPDHDIY
jgi:hypothetical protein